MTRSIKKGINVDEKLLKKIAGKNPLQTPMIKTWKRACQISPEMVGFTFGVHNGKVHVEVLVSEDMVGHRLGEFSLTRKFTRHGGKMQKELDQKKKEAEIAAAQAARAGHRRRQAPGAPGAGGVRPCGLRLPGACPPVGGRSRTTEAAPGAGSFGDAHRRN